MITKMMFGNASDSHTGKTVGMTNASNLYETATGVKDGKKTKDLVIKSEIIALSEIPSIAKDVPDAIVSGEYAVRISAWQFLDRCAYVLLEDVYRIIRLAESVIESSEANKVRLNLIDLYGNEIQIHIHLSVAFGFEDKLCINAFLPDDEGKMHKHSFQFNPDAIFDMGCFIEALID
jgi:hypothetical protein